MLEKGLDFAPIQKTLNRNWNSEKILKSSSVGWDVSGIFEINQLIISVKYQLAVLNRDGNLLKEEVEEELLILISNTILIFIANKLLV